MTKQHRDTRITVKNVKTLAGVGPEGDAWTCSVYFDGRRVGTASYGGWGGPVDFKIKSAAVEKQMRDHVDTLPGWVSEFDGSTNPQSLDIIVEEAMCAYREEKYLRRAVKTKIVARHVGQAPGQYHEWKHRWTPAKAKDLRRQISMQLAKEGMELAEILNERFV